MSLADLRLQCTGESKIRVPSLNLSTDIIGWSKKYVYIYNESNKKIFLSQEIQILDNFTLNLSAGIIGCPRARCWGNQVKRITEK